MNTLYLLGLALLSIGTIFRLKIKKYGKLTDLLFLITLSYFFVGVALSGAKIYLAGLILLICGVIVCKDITKSSLIVPLAICTEYYIFIGLVVNAIQYLRFKL